MHFSASALKTRLLGWPAPGRYVALVSGGCDSMVLMYALAEIASLLPAPVSVLHFDHGLSDQSADWQKFVKSRAEALGLPFHSEKLGLEPGPGAETRAREARYARLREWMEMDDCCLSAHHADDQLETFLLHALRGSGTTGLAGIRPLMRFGPGWLGRPLLEWSRAELNAWAGRRKLQWIEDPANRDLSVPRNWLRAQIGPSLSERWPQAPHTIARSARLAGEADAVLAEVAREDLARLDLGHPACISVSGLLALSEARRRNVLRHWLRERQLPMPSARKLLELDKRFIRDVPGGMAELNWHGACVRRYRDCLFAQAPWPPPTPEKILEMEPGRPLDLGYLGEVRLVRDPEGPLAESVMAVPLTVRFRRGGERLRPAGSIHHRTLKNLLQEQAVLPWMRLRLPLLYAGDRLASVAGVVGATEEFSGQGCRFVWTKRPPIHHTPPDCSE
ncbi:MAG TPA: tRNA lysidine(34) synthetase TilS [Gammaproteobacteria bacterium]|nr:tRNA lysidine(34) synthetase TilS [Gammaproteobacteria bacterium]